MEPMSEKTFNNINTTELRKDPWEKEAVKKQRHNRRGKSNNVITIKYELS